MITHTIVAKNTTSGTITFPDLGGFYVVASGTETLSDYFKSNYIEASVDLIDNVQSGDIVINDGEKDLTIQQGLYHVKDLSFQKILEYLAALRVLDLADTPTTYSGAPQQYLRVRSDLSGVEYGLTEYDLLSLFSFGEFSGNPTYDGLIRLLGWYEQTNVTQAGAPGDKVELLSGSSYVSNKEGFHSHFITKITTVSGEPFGITVSGTTVNEATGNYLSDSELLTISGTGYYQTAKSFIDAPIFSIVEDDKSCEMDVYRSTYWDAQNQNFIVEGCRFEWTPDQPNWNLHLRIGHHLNDGSVSYIDEIIFAHDDTYPRAAQNEPGKYKRGDYNTFVNGANNEGIFIDFDQRAIGHYYFELRFTIITEASQ